MKKLNDKILGLALLVLMPVTLFADNGSSVRGGGSVVGRGSNATLADFLSPGVCMPQDGVEVYNELPALHAILNKVKRLDWYLALILKREIKRLTFCWTNLPENFMRARADQGLSCDQSEEDDLVSDQIFQLHPRERMTAFREGLTVVIDQGEYRSLNSNIKSMQLIHEASHAFFPAGISVCQRQRLVRGFTSVMEAVRIGTIRNRSRLHFALQNLSSSELGRAMDSWITNDQLDRNRSQVEFYFSQIDEQKSVVLSSLNPESLVDSLSEVYESLGDNSETNYYDFLANIIASIMQEGSLDEFRSLFQKSYTQISPEMIAISLYSQLSQEKVAFLVEMNFFNNAINQYWNTLSESQIVQGRSRILAGYHVRSLGAQTAREGMSPLTRTLFRRRGIDQVSMPTGLRAAAQFLAVLVMENKWQLVRTLYSANPNFYTALGLKNQRRQLEEMTPLVERERRLGLSILEELRGRIQNERPQSGILESFFSHVQSILVQYGLGEKHEQLLREINFHLFVE